MAVTFGSVGDIIAVGQLIQDLVSLLDDSRGSRSEYQSLVDQLKILGAVLARAGDSCRDDDWALPELRDTRDALIAFVADAERRLDGVRNKIRKYSASLASGGSGNAVKDFARKVQWRLERGETDRLRDDVVRFSDQISRLLSIAHNTRLLRAIQQSGEDTKQLIQRLDERAAARHAILETQLSTLPHRVGSAVVLVMMRGATVVWWAGSRAGSSLLDAFSSLQGLLNRPERPLSFGDVGDYFIFEDYMGTDSVMTLAYFDSWETLEGSLHGRFVASKKKGGRRVAEGRYLLQYLDTGDEIDRGMSWDVAIRPGQRMTMSLICELIAAEEKDADRTLKCPSCKTFCEDTPGKTVRCPSCGNLLQRLDLFHYDDEAPEAPDAPDSHGTSDAAKVADKARSGNVGASNPLGPNSGSSRGRGRRKYPRRQPVSGSGEELSDEENTEGIKNIAVAHVAKPPSSSSVRVHCASDGDDKAPFEEIILRKDKKKARKQEAPRLLPRNLPRFPYHQPATWAAFNNSRPSASVDGSGPYEGFSYHGGYYPQSRPGKYTTSSVSPIDFPRRLASTNSNPKHGRRDSYSYYRPDSPDSDNRDDEYVTLGGVTYVLPALSRSNRHTGTYYEQFSSYYDSSPYNRRDTRYQKSPRYGTRISRPAPPSRSKTATSSRPQTGVKPKGCSQRTATAEDAKKHGIPHGYSLKNWDPDEEPFIVLGSVFDLNSLGKWIYDWTVFVHGASTPLADLAGDLWLTLVKLACQTSQAEEAMPNIRSADDREMVEDFLESKQRLMDKLRRILKICEQPMLRRLHGTNAERRKKSEKESGEKESSEKESSEKESGETEKDRAKAAGHAFIDTMFGRERQLEAVEKLMARMRLWSVRFDQNCDDIIKKPTGAEPKAPRARAEKESANAGDGPEGAGASSVAAQAGSDIEDKHREANDEQDPDETAKNTEGEIEDKGREEAADGGAQTDEHGGHESEGEDLVVETHISPVAAI